MKKITLLATMVALFGMVSGQNLFLHQGDAKPYTNYSKVNLNNEEMLSSSDLDSVCKWIGNNADTSNYRQKLLEGFSSYKKASDRSRDQKISFSNFAIHYAIGSNRRSTAMQAKSDSLNLLARRSLEPDKFRAAKADINGEYLERETKANAYINEALEFYYDADRKRPLFFPLFHWKFCKFINKRDLIRAKSVLTQLHFNGHKSDRLVSFLTENRLIFDPEGNLSLYSELATDYFLFGKLSINAQLSRTVEDSTDEAITRLKKQTFQSLVSGGGNLGIAFDIPLMNGRIGDKIRFGNTLTLPSLGLQIPGLNETLTSPMAQVEFGTETHFAVDLWEGNIAVYGTHKFSVLTGDNSFKSKILNGEGAITYNQFSAGILFSESFLLGATWFSGNNFVRNNFPGQMLSLTIIPK